MNTAELKNYNKQRDEADLIKSQQLATDHLMKTLSNLPLTREAVVAGGAPREWFRQRPASDIDIFLIGTSIAKRQIEEEMQKAGLVVKELTGGDWYQLDDSEYYRNPGIKWVYDGHVGWRSSIHGGEHKVKFQVIVTVFQDLSQLLTSFPVEISKFTWNHITRKIHGEPGAIKDMAEKTVTKTGFDYKRGDKYVQKICQKFPDHTFINMFDKKPNNQQATNHPYRTMAAETTSDQTSQPTMDPVAFAFWLQGFFEMANPTTMNEQQTAMVKDHLALVFNKVTPNRNGDVFMPKPVRWPTNAEEQRQRATEIKGKMLEVRINEVPEPSVTAPFATYNGNELARVSPTHVSAAKPV